MALVIVNTGKGKEAWARVAPGMDVLASDLEHAAGHNLSYAGPVPPHPDRDRFFSDLNGMGFEEVMEKYCGDPDLRPVDSGH